MSKVIEEAKTWLADVRATLLHESHDEDELLCRIGNLIEELEKREAVVDAAKFLVKVKCRKDTQPAWYLASWPIALRKIEEALDNLENNPN